ncbi:hypothetical protein TNCV_2370591 [Trichonephila clavipes]|nr:hypothetical protein TNCV_2370591 [Trichonephila clavipes]
MFLNSPLIISPHKTLNSCRGVISEPDLLTTPESEILDGFSDQGVIQLSQTYAQAAKSSTSNNSTQTDETITKIKCPPLKLLEPLSSKSRPTVSISTPNVSRSSSTQAQLLPSSSSITAAFSEPQPPIPTSNDAPSTKMFTPIRTSSSIILTSSSNSVIQPPSASNMQDAKKISKVRARKRKKELLKKMNDAVIEIKMAQHRPRKPASVEYTTDEEDMIIYDVEEDESASGPDYVQKDGKTYFRESSLLTPTRSRK